MKRTIGFAVAVSCLLAASAVLLIAAVTVSLLERWNQESRWRGGGGPPFTHRFRWWIAASESGVIALVALLAAIGVIAWRTLAGTVKGASEHAEPAKAREETAAPEGEITWKDLVPFSGWRMMNCAMFALS